VEADPSLAALVHLKIGNLQVEQIHGLLAAQSSTDLAPRFASARSHFETLRDKYPDAPVNQERFRTPAAASVTRLVLDRLAKLEAWEGKHGLKAVEADADPIVVLRTSEGDLRLRFFSQASPLATAAFLARVCEGGLDDTLLVQKRDDATEAWVRGGDPRTKGALDAKDPDRVAWGTASPIDPRAPEEGRNQILHTKGTVSLWHESGEVADDPLQFLLVLKPSSRLDYDYTPFARVDGEASLATLERIAARRTRAQETPDLRTDAALSSLADHLLQPVVIRKALVFEAGALKACHDASKVGDDEQKLADLKLDAYRD
jgi:cyclophilin family peptidyl-prolyl cis-trans isomerase